MIRLLLPLLLLASTAAADPLDDAFERERAVLREELSSLKTRLDEERARIGERERALRRRLEAVSDSVGAIELEVETLRARASDRRASTGVADPRAALGSAVSVLTDRGVDLSGIPDGTVAEQTRAVIDRALSAFETASGFREESGSFFDADGREVTGRIVHVGRIARLGSSESAGGALAPAGGGAWRVVDGAGRETVRALIDGEPVESLPIYLTDPLLGEGGSTKSRSINDLLAAGGMLVWPILALAVVALLIVVDRSVRILRARRNARSFAGWSAGDGVDWPALEARCRENPGPMSRVIESALLHRGADGDVLEGVIDGAVLEETERLDRFLPSLRAIAAVAPLLGLLGTVTGMIRTFDVITDFGTGNPKLLSGGISEALITTEVGLGVAIPTLLVYSVLSGAVDGIANEMERRGLRVGLAMRRERASTGARE